MSDVRASSIDWRSERRVGMGAIAGATLVAALLWFATYSYAPVPSAESIAERLVLAIKCIAVATLFCLVAGVEAVAHERLQSPAFDPLRNYESRRIRVNLRYLQNTLEQSVVFAVALLGLAIYAEGRAGAAAMVATTIVWIAGRLAFWIGYHRSAALRGLGAPGMMASMIVLLYVVWHVGEDIAGPAGGWILIGAFLALEAVLFRTTASEEAQASS